MFESPSKIEMTISLLPCDGQTDLVCARGGRLVPKQSGMQQQQGNSALEIAWSR